MSLPQRSALPAELNQRDLNRGSRTNLKSEANGGGPLKDTGPGLGKAVPSAARAPGPGEAVTSLCTRGSVHSGRCFYRLWLFLAVCFYGSESWTIKKAERQRIF